MTPRQLSALTDRRSQRQEREELLVGLLASVTANYSMAAPNPPLSAADFIPGRKRPAYEPETDEDLAFQFAAILSPVSVPVQP